MITSYLAPVISLSVKCGYSVTTRGISEIYDTLTHQFLSSVGVWTSPRAICFTQAPSFVKRLCFICLYDSQAVNRTISKGISSPWINLRDRFIQGEDSDEWGNNHDSNTNLLLKCFTVSVFEVNGWKISLLKWSCAHSVLQQYLG